MTLNEIREHPAVIIAGLIAVTITIYGFIKGR